MSIITNMMFWLNSAMETIASAIGVAAIVFIISLIGIGYGIGRVWNSKWKISSIGILVSLPLSLIAAILTMVWVGMGFISETYSRLNVPKQTLGIIESITKPSLIKRAFEAGVKQISDKGVGVDPEKLIDPTTEALTIPSDTPEAAAENMKLFVSGAMNVLNKGVVPASKKAKKTELGLEDMPPFSYGFKTINQPNESIVANVSKEFAERGLEGMPLSLSEPSWFEAILKPVVDANMGDFNKKMCKNIDKGRTNVLILLIAILLIQTGLISWLAFIDIKPRKVDLG